MKILQNMPLPWTFRQLKCIDAVKVIGMKTTCGILCLILALSFLSSCDKHISSGSAQEIRILESIEVDSVTSDFPVSFAFIEKDGQQIIAYYNKNRNMTVASKTLLEGKWNYKVLPTKVGWDSHNRIKMVIDRDNCIHVSGNMHADSMTYFKTTSPFDITTFQQVFPLVSEEDELKCTYPNFLKTPEGQIVYSYRKGGSGNGITITNVYNEETKSFSRLSDKPLFDGLGQMSAYFRGPELGPDGYYHLSWLWRDTPSCETNHDLSYARSKDLVNWETIEGEKFQLPITPDIRDFTVDPVPAGGGVINGAHKLFFGPDNSAILAYMKYDEHGNNQYFIAQEQQGQWRIRQVSDWNYRWEFSGPGSIDFQIKLQDAKVGADGKISIKYWHVNRGDGELVIDLNLLELLEDQSVDVVQEAIAPKALQAPERSEEGMMVHWLEPAGSKDRSGPYYALRWETMGKRRFYKAPETPVKPSSLKLYRFVQSK